MSDLMSVANALVEACRSGKERDLLQSHYAPEAVSVEAVAMGEAPRETHGIEGINGKHDWWDANFEVHEAKVSDPMPHGEDRFAVIFEIDATEKASGNRIPMKEVAIYTVGDGKIVKEEFFYGMG